MRIFDSIPVEELSATAKAIAEKLDANEFVVRTDPKLVGNRRLEADEVRFALQNLDAFAVEHRPVILELARALGVEMPTSIPKKWVDRSSPDPKWTSAYLDAVPIGNFVFVSDRRYGVIRYDATHDQWFKMAKPGFDQEYLWWQSPGLGAFQGKLAMIGTYPRQTGPAWGYARLYDPVTGNIERLPNCAPRTRCAVAEHDVKLYVFGGSIFTNEQSAMLGSPIDSVQVYDRAAGNWRDLPPLPEARYGAKAITLDDKIYVIGGRGLNGSSKRIDIFDPKSEQWLDPLFMATPRLNPTAWIEDGKLHISGGMSVGPIKLHNNDPQRAGGQGEYQDIDTSTEILNPLTKSFSQGATSPFDGDEAGVIAMTNDGRKFSFSIKQVTGSTPAIRSSPPTASSIAASRTNAAI